MTRLRRLVAAWASPVSAQSRLTALGVALALGAMAVAVDPGSAVADDVGNAGVVPVGTVAEVPGGPAAPLELHADSLEYEASRRLYVAQGNVVIRREDRELRADWVAYSELTRRGVASGDVFFTDGTDTLSTSFVEFDIDSLEGVFFDAEFVNK